MLIEEGEIVDSRNNGKAVTDFPHLMQPNPCYEDMTTNEFNEIDEIALLDLKNRKRLVKNIEEGTCSASMDSTSHAHAKLLDGRVL